ncbi:guanylate cyclase, putative, partial [Bodo saltans]
GLGANPQRNSAAMNEKELFSEPEDEEMMLAGHASRNTTQANPFTNAAVVPAASSPDQIDNNEAQQAYVSFVDSVKDVEGQQSPSARREKLSSVSVYPRPRRLNLSSSLASRRVTVACCNIVGTHASFGSRGPAETQRQLGIVLGAIERAVEVERGVIDLYHGDRVMVSFNASTVLTSSGPRAARTILRVCKELDEPGVPAVRWGVSTGNAVVGNFGTNRTRRFCVCGPVVNQAFALMLHCRAEGVLNLVAPLTYDLIKDDFVVEHRNLVALTIGGSHTAPTIISTILRERSQSLSTSRWSNSTSPPAVVQSDAPVTTNMDEETLDKLNRAFEALERGEVADAFTLASELPRDLG